MTLLAVLEAVALVAIVLINTYQHGKVIHDHAIARDAWTEERRELLNRIQAPQHLPIKAADGFDVPEREPDDYARVGQIDLDPAYLTADED